MANLREELLDRVRYTILKAPDRFPLDTGISLDKSFAELQCIGERVFRAGTAEAYAFAHALSSALHAYRAGSQKSAISELQKVESFLAGRSKELGP